MISDTPSPPRARVVPIALVAAGLAAAVLLASCGAHRRAPDGVEVAGLPNFARVDDGLFRSAQPTAEGFAEARRLGVRTVLNLRSEHDDRPLLQGTGLAYASVPTHAWHAETEDVAAALRLLTDPARRPVLVHCAQGQDRTGVVVAAYRVVVEGWTNEAAVEEMRAFGNSSLWANLRAWVRGLDPAAMRARMAATSPPLVEPPR